MFSLQVELKLELTHPLGFQRRGVDLITGQGSKISHALQLKSQNAKQKQYCNKFSKECKNQFRSVQSLNHVRLFVTLWTAAHQASLSITNSRSLLIFIFTESVMPSNYVILWRPLLLPPSIFPSIRVFSNESVLHMRWPKYWSFSFSIIPPKEHPGLISFRMDWLELLAVQGTLKSLLQHHCLKTSILWCSAFFTVQLSHLYMTTGKTIALITRTFVGRVVSLLFDILSRFVTRL